MNIWWDLAEWTRDSPETNNNFFHLSFLFFWFLLFCFSGEGSFNNSVESKEKAYPKSTGSFSHPQTIPCSDAQPQKFKGDWRLYTQFHGSYKQIFVPIPSMTWLQQLHWLNFYIWGLHVHFLTERPQYFIYASTTND